jgi:hypothetical protein
VAAAFGRLASVELLEEPETVKGLLGAPGLSDDDVAALAVFLVRSPEETRARDCLLTQLLECLARRKVAPTEAVHFGAHVLATAPSSRLRAAALAYMQTAGPQNEFYAHWVAREFNEENYAAFCRQGGEPEPPPPPSSWQDWEEHGWWRAPEDWPIAGLFFGLETAEAEVNQRLRRLHSPLVPAAQTLHYFLLHRLWRATTTTLVRVSAIGELIEDIQGVAGLEPLYDRALLVFRNHWRRLQMGELAELAAEVYLDLCDLQREFEPGTEKLPPLLEGLDIGHLEKSWRQGPERWALLALK